MRSIVGAVVVSLALIGVVLAVAPVPLGYLGILMPVAALLLSASGVYWIRKVDDGEEIPPAVQRAILGTLLLCGLIVSVAFWSRVWDAESETANEQMLQVLYRTTFWWPGLLVAAVAWLLEGMDTQRTYKRFLATLGVGILGSVIGTGSYEVGSAAYYRARDPQSLKSAMEEVRTKASGITPESVQWQLNDGVLSNVVSLEWASSAPPYTALSTIDRYLAGARELLARKDVERVDVSVIGAEGPIARYTADESQAAEPVHAKASYNLFSLKNEGRLDKTSLEEMAWVRPREFSTAEQADKFRQIFRYELKRRTITISFDEQLPPTMETVDLWANAYRTANRIINETVRFFPEMEQFVVRLGAEERIVPCESVTPGEFQLQEAAIPPGKVLGLLVRDSKRREAALEPSTFASQDGSVFHHPIAVLRSSKGRQQALVGRLFERIALDPGSLYVTEVSEDGTTTVFYAPEKGVPNGPNQIPPNEQTLVGNLWINSSGLLDTSLFKTTPEAVGEG